MVLAADMAWARGRFLILGARRENRSMFLRCDADVWFVDDVRLSLFGKGEGEGEGPGLWGNCLSRALSLAAGTSAVV